MNSWGRQLYAFTSRSSRLCRQQLETSTILFRISRRSLHQRRELEYPEDAGFGDFLPPEALRTVLDWQDGLLERLNGEVRGTEYENKDVFQTMLDFSYDKSKILAYNCACLALNNSFFLDRLKPPVDGQSTHEGDISKELLNDIQIQIEGLDRLKESFIATASGMTTSGWLWFVADHESRLAVAQTFGAGTPLIRSRTLLVQSLEDAIVPRRDSSGAASQPLWNSAFTSSQSNIIPPLRDLPAASSPVSGINTLPPPLNPQTPSRSLHYSSLARNQAMDENTDTVSIQLEERRKMQHGIGSKLYPLFCISMHEHAWMSAGLGVWGKEEYVRRFFSVLDWRKVSEAYAVSRTETFRHTRML